MTSREEWREVHIEEGREERVFEKGGDEEIGRAALQIK